MRGIVKADSQNVLSIIEASKTKHRFKVRRRRVGGDVRNSEHTALELGRSRYSHNM